MDLMKAEAKAFISVVEDLSSSNTFERRKAVCSYWI